MRIEALSLRRFRSFVLAGLFLVATSATSHALPPVGEATDQGLKAVAFVTVDTDWQEKWSSQRTETPNFSTHSKVRPGETITLVLLFAGASSAADGGISLECDVRVVGPGGTVLGELPTTSCADGTLSGPNTDLYLAKHFVEIEIREDFPKGPLTFEAGIRDVHRNLRVPIAVGVDVVGADE